MAAQHKRKGASARQARQQRANERLIALVELYQRAIRYNYAINDVHPEDMPRRISIAKQSLSRNERGWVIGNYHYDQPYIAGVA